MSVQDWIDPLRSALESLCAAWGIPVGVAVGWIETESGGHLAETTSLDERGYFQLMPSESKGLGLDHERLSRDSSYSLAGGMRIMDYYRRFVRQLCITTGVATYVQLGSEYEWRLIKLSHSMGMGSVRAILSDAVDVNSTISWDMLKSFALGHNEEYLRRLKHAPAKWFPFVDRVFQIGEPYGTSVLMCEPVPKRPLVG